MGIAAASFPAEARRTFQIQHLFGEAPLRPQQAADHRHDVEEERQHGEQDHDQQARQVGVSDSHALPGAALIWY